MTMHLKNVAVALLDQLGAVAMSIDDDDYAQPLPLISNATVGKHIRHTLEFVDIMVTALKTGTISYDKRAHDKSLDTDRQLALHMITKLKIALKQLDQNVDLTLEVEFPLAGISLQNVPTNLLRELVYNIEHMVHHMAILKIALANHFPSVELSGDFGVAQSTLVYQAQ
jgi:uncharacterized damage-inducible protein DinB